MSIPRTGSAPRTRDGVERSLLGPPRPLGSWLEDCPSSRGESSGRWPALGVNQGDGASGPDPRDSASPPGASFCVAPGTICQYLVRFRWSDGPVSGDHGRTLSARFVGVPRGLTLPGGVGRLQRLPACLLQPPGCFARGQPLRPCCCAAFAGLGGSGRRNRGVSRGPSWSAPSRLPAGNPQVSRLALGFTCGLGWVWPAGSEACARSLHGPHRHGRRPNPPGQPGWRLAPGPHLARTPSGRGIFRVPATVAKRYCLRAR